MPERTFLLVDAGMVAGFRRAKPSLGQLHQALVHLNRQHPEAHVAVLADPALKWDLATGEGAAFDGDIVAGAVVCAPAGALDGVVGFFTRVADRATACGHRVVAFTDRALTGVPLGSLRNESGSWVWDLDATRTIDAARAPAPARRRRSRR